METILFADSEVSLPADTAAESTIPGKLFEAGSYPDKGVEITEADLDAAIESFTAAPMNYEHKAGVLDGALGAISRLWREGAALMADFTVPHFLRDFARAQGTPLKVSAEWDRASKRLTGAAWTLNPRIKDAELVAAFSVAQDEGNQTEKPVIVPPVEHHHQPPRITVRTGDIHMTAAEKRLRSLVNEGKATFSEDEITAMFAEDNAAESKRRELEITTAAAKFADDTITAKRAFPFERTGLIALFTQAAKDDAATTETITFSVGDTDKTGSRRDLVRATFDAKIPHNLDAELMDPKLSAAELAAKLATATIAFSAETTRQTGEVEKPSPEKTAKLLAMTTEGRAALAAKGGK